LYCEQVRYYLVRDCTLTAGTGGAYAIFRTNNGDARYFDNVSISAALGSGTNGVRLHAAADNGIHNVMIDCFSDGPEKVKIHNESGGGTTLYKLEVWLIRCTFDLGIENGAIRWWVTGHSVMRHCVLRASPAMAINVLPSSAQPGPIYLEHNTLITLNNSSNAGFILGAHQRQFIIKNNIVHSESTSGSITFMDVDGSARSPTAVLTACDGNLLFVANGGSASWASGFSSGNGSLATWQGATPFDDNSIAGTTGTEDPELVAPTGTLDAHIGATSAALDVALALNYIDLDFDSKVSESAFDIGADDRAATEDPIPVGAKVVDETEGITESVIYILHQVVNETVGITETTPVTTTEVLGETEGITETTVVVATVVVNETESITESVIYVLHQVVNETEGITEAINVVATVVVDETEGITETDPVAVLVQGVQVVDETEGITESVIYILHQVVNETEGITESVSYTLPQLVSEAESITESVIYVLHQVVNETEGITETIPVVATVVVNETMGVAETAIQPSTVIVIDETEGITEAKNTTGVSLIKPLDINITGCRIGDISITGERIT